MTATLTLIALLNAPVPVDVDVIELNHVYSVSESRDEFGRMQQTTSFVASYFLFWAWTNEGLHIRDWVKADHRCTLSRDTLTVSAKRLVMSLQHGRPREKRPTGISRGAATGEGLRR